jgi:cellulose biosynthesis protein BcsQ
MTKKKTNGSVGASTPVGDDAMFSAASFAGVIAIEPSPDVEVPTPPPLREGTVVAFYGFRGGAGRTTALAHFAAALSARDVSTVAIDLDVEAPGLDRVLNCPPLTEDVGAVALLRAAAQAETDEERSSAMRLAPHVVKSRLDVGAPIRVLPAGRLSTIYLERLEDLGVALWHIAEPPSPLRALVDQLRSELKPDVILIDCRTGLSGLSASAMFHVADLVVLCVTVTDQSIEGLEIVLRGVHAARSQRGGSPDLLIVPTMVPEGPEGRARLDEFLAKIDAQYAAIFRQNAVDLDPSEQTPVVREGVEYRRGVALADHLRADFVQRSAGTYQALTRELDRLLGLDKPANAELKEVDAQGVLDELESSNLKKLAFAEEVGADELVEKFIRPGDFRAITDPTTWYVVGAKGAGKTWMWRYLLSDVAHDAVPKVSFLAGHGPKDNPLTASAFRELEKSARLPKRQLYGTAMVLYAAWRLLRASPDVAGRISKQWQGEAARAVKDLAGASPTKLQEVLVATLERENVGTFAERLIKAIDAGLLDAGSETSILIYDDLDVGFGSDTQAIERRRKFVSGFVEAIEPFRGACKRIAFKLFLREDVFAEIGIQNQSHLGAATVELEWKSGDIWGLVLNVLSDSAKYCQYIKAIDPTATVGNWPAEEERRLRLLVPLWGDQMERGNKIQTGRFIQRRTADGKERLFPRTVIQLLAKAIESQRAAATVPDRVLRSAAIQSGYVEASKQRVADLRKEYKDLEIYLDAFEERPPTGTESEIVNHLKKKAAKRTSAGARGGAAKGAYHAGRGGWAKVIPRLLEVGVMREYRRARGESGETKYEIALLYRPGLGIKTFGV